MQQLLEGLDDAAIAMRADTNLTIAAWNHRTEQLFHRAAEDAIGRPSIEAAPSADPQKRAQRTADTRRDGWWHGRSTLLTSLAELIVVETFCVLVRTWCGTLEYVSIVRPAEDDPQKGRLETPAIFAQIASDFGVLNKTRLAYQTPEPPLGSGPVTVMGTNEVGTRLRKAREHAGLSKYMLAKRANVHPSQIAEWEKGDHVPTPMNLRRLIPYIGGTTDYYLFGIKG